MDSTQSFAGLGVSDSIIRALSQLGIETPSEIQAAAIPEALEGKDVCGKASTGSGKTFAFGIPLVQLAKRSKPLAPNALVLVPTRELALQVRNVLFSLSQTDPAKKVWIEAFYGGVPIDRQIRALRKGVSIVVATPGRLLDLIGRGAMYMNSLERIVLDEADLMADMGFLPDVEEILSHVGNDHQTMLFSATLDGYVDVLRKRHMNNPVTHEVAQNDDRTELMSHHFLYVDSRSKNALLSKVTKGAERSLVFVRTRDSAEVVAQTLYEDGADAELLTGAIKQSARERVLRRFAQGKTQVLVATDVAARGLDISGLDLVVHYDMPDDEKAFVHRSGRTARAGKTGVVVTFVQGNQVRSLLRIQELLGLSQPILKVDLNDPALAGIAQGEQPNAQEYKVHTQDRSRSTSSSGSRWSSQKRSTSSGSSRSGGGYASRGRQSFDGATQSKRRSSY